jgi:hypothetical protein
MKAVRLLEDGGQLVFHDVPTPTIVHDEILVEIKSTAVNHLDLVEASGTARQYSRLTCRGYLVPSFQGSSNRLAVTLRHVRQVMPYSAPPVEWVRMRSIWQSKRRPPQGAVVPGLEGRRLPRLCHPARLPGRGRDARCIGRDNEARAVRGRARQNRARMRAAFFRS